MMCGVNMTIDLNTLVVVGGIIVNILAVVSYSNRHERRMTRVETVLNILASRAGLHTRTDDHFKFRDPADKKDNC